MKYKKQNFLQLYQYLCGTTEIPRGFQGWAALSLIAALAEKRMWFEKFKGSKLFPNIYTLLIGPSGIGKGGAIGHALRFLDAAELDPPLNVYRGSSTHAHLEDILGKPRRQITVVDDEEIEQWIYPPSNLWLVQDELANNLGSKELAERFIKMMTEMFTGDYDISGGTRTHGSRKIEKPAVTWFAGTTTDWLFDVLSRKEIFSGATARMFVCFREYQDIRYPEPKSPPDYDEVLKHLVGKIRSIHIAEGPFRFTGKAQKIKNQWYMSRVVPNDDQLLASWKRGDDLIIKLCMIFSLADSTDRVIKPHHFIQARATFDNAFKDLDQLMELACGTKEKEDTNFVESVIKKEGTLNRTKLAKKVYKRGILAAKLDHIVKDIEARGKIKIHTTKTGASVYEWIG